MKHIVFSIVMLSPYICTAQLSDPTNPCNICTAQLSDPTNPCNTYVCVTTVDTVSGRTSTYCDLIEVDVTATDSCGHAHFSHYENSPVNIYFADASTGTATNWYWDFGDGNASTDQSPDHTYTASGAYTVCLTTVDTVQSCSDTYCQTVTITDSTSVKELTGNVMNFENYPNPFSENTTINYSINTKAKVDLGVYDVLGNKVAVLVNEIQSGGHYSIEFNAGNLSSGVYLLQMVVEREMNTKRLVITR